MCFDDGVVDLFGNASYILIIRTMNCNDVAMRMMVDP